MSRSLGKRLAITMAMLLLIPALVVVWLGVTESGLQWVYQQARPYLPDTLEIERLQGRLIGPITIGGFHYRQAGAQYDIDELVFNWQASALMTTTLNVERAKINRVNIVLPASAKPQEPDQALTPLPDIQLPWRLIFKNVEINNINIRQAEQQVHLNRVSVDASTLFSRITIEKLRLLTDEAQLDVKGHVKLSGDYDHELELRWQTSLPPGTTVKGRGKLAGTLKSSQLKQQLSGPVQLSLDAQLHDLFQQFNWQANINVSEFNLALLNEQWPALTGSLNLQAEGDLDVASVSGKLDGYHPETGSVKADFQLQRQPGNTIHIDRLQIHAPVSDTRMTAKGQWRPGQQGGEVKLDLKWANLRWPIQTTPWFSSAEGKASVAGNVDQYQVTLETDSPWPQAAPSTWYASADGNRSGLMFNTLRIRALEGEAIATGQLNWLPALNWQASARVSRINPASRWLEWPGKLNARLTSQGQLDNGQLKAGVDIEQLNGQLRGHPVTLKSRLGWQQDALVIESFNLRSRESRVNLQGRLGDTVDLAWRIDSGNLNQLHPQASGQLKAQGRVSGRRDTPLLSASVNGKKLKLAQYGAGAIDGTLAVDLFHWQQFDVQLVARSLQLNNYVMQSLNINADTAHIQLQAVADKTRAQIELRGESYPGGWRGYVERADFMSSQYSDWRLVSPAAVNVSNKSLVAETLCWHNNEQARICSTITKDEHSWQSELEVKRAPLMLLAAWLPDDLKLTGVVDATGHLQYRTPDQLEGKLEVVLPPGTVTYPLQEGEADSWQYRDGRLVARLDKQGLNIVSDLAMNNGDAFHLTADLPGMQLLKLRPAEQALKANMQLHVHELALLEVMLPEVQDMQGQARLDLNADGMLSSPRIRGKVELTGGALRIPRLGLSISKLTLLGESEGFDKLNLNIKARSGDGELSVQSQTELNRAAGWPTHMTIRGRQFEVARIPEARVNISPELELRMQHRNIEVSGKLHVPYARLQPKDITTAERVSGDAVIIGGEQPDESKWSTVARIRVTLGEQVNLYGFGFDGRLAGSLLLVDEPGQLTTATGEISIPEGRYRAYGQRLEVEHGRLLYTGGPLTNPGLDIRAVRHVNNVTAGLKIWGNLDQPQVELFSIPAMGQTDTLSYLLLGRPIENASEEEGSMMAKAALALGLSEGNRVARMLSDRFGLDEMRVESSDTGERASLVMGRYLSPRLYVSYGIGLVEAFNTFTVRYQLAEKWHIKAESGEHQGADIQYTIER